MERILFFVPNLFSGGTETFIMNMYRNIDRTKYQFDFAVHTNKKGVFEEEIEKLGGRIFRFSIKDDKNFIRYSKDLNSFFDKHKEYKIVHSCMPSIAWIYLKIAKKHGVNIRIAHSHSAGFDHNFRGILKHINTMFIKNYSNLNLACSNLAGKYMFGNKDFTIVHNAIDINKYVYNEESRNEIRNGLEIDDKVVIGHIGRISKEKNHLFMIELMKRLPNKYVLLCVGSGPDQSKIQEIINEENLSDRIILVGNKPDAYKYYSAFDLFILPSLYEGLPTVAVEAQVSGLKCLLSSNITDEVNINGDVKFIELDVEKWKSNILKMNIERNKVDLLSFKSYDIKYEAKALEKIYESALGDK